MYRASDPRLGRSVAIKVQPPEFTSDPDRVARFAREARLLASVNHPHIATVHGIEEAGGVRGLVLELVEGSTLSERLAAGPMTVHDALTVARQIAEALEAAFGPGQPEALITATIPTMLDSRPHYDVTRDGQRFLLRQPDGPSGSKVTVIVNWPEKLKR